MKQARRQTWIEAESDDEVTREVCPLSALVSDDVAAVTPDTPLETLRQILVERRIAAIVVVDRARALLGIVTRTDVLRHVGIATATAAEVMSNYVFALPADAAVECAAALMALEGVGQVIVIGAERTLLGVVSAVDIARHVATRAGYLVR